MPSSYALTASGVHEIAIRRCDERAREAIVHLPRERYERGTGAGSTRAHHASDETGEPDTGVPLSAAARRFISSCSAGLKSRAAIGKRI
jgi:hypothetical protein